MNKKLKALLIMGVKEAGTFDPNKALCFVEEQMTVGESKKATEFLGWVHKNDKTFGHNIDDVYKEFQHWKCDRTISNL